MDNAYGTLLDMLEFYRVTAEHLPATDRIKYLEDFWKRQQFDLSLQLLSSCAVRDLTQSRYGLLGDGLGMLLSLPFKSSRAV